MKRRGFLGAVAALIAAPLVPARQTEPVREGTWTVDANDLRTFQWRGHPATIYLDGPVSSVERSRITFVTVATR